MLKYYITMLLWKFTKIFNRFFELIWEKKKKKKKIGNLHACFIWAIKKLLYLRNWMNQSNFQVLCLDVLIMDITWKMQNSLYVKDHCVWAFICLSPAMKQLLDILYFESWHALNFSCIWNKQGSFCRLSKYCDVSHKLA